MTQCFFLCQEFVFFLLPLINVPKLKNMIVRQFSRPISLDKQPSIKVACHECGICNEPPTSPHQGQCGHVFCYYCIKVKYNLLVLCCFVVVSSPPPRRSTPSYKPYRSVPPQRVGVLRRLSENGYRLCLFWSAIWYDFRGNYGKCMNVFTILVPND